MLRARIFVALAALAALAVPVAAQNPQDQYQKYEYMIPMRDGAKLYTAAYVPKSLTGQSPILLERTPYSAGPYGPTAYRGGHRGSQKFKDAQYIFAYQDVRGHYMSEGTFVDVRPQLSQTFQHNGIEPNPHDIDESTDTYDTVDYLIKNVPHTNGRVGIWGISYPGGYAALGALCGHPALVAASPQAPTADWFLGDDFHHNGAFMLQDFISFYSGFGVVQDKPGPTRPPGIPININGDAYKYFLDLGGLANVETKLYKGQIPFWQDGIRNDTYNDFWQARSIPSHLINVKPACLWVGGFYDAEDCYGPMACYKAMELTGRQPNNWLVMGPWYHGMWASGAGQKFHVHDWGSNTSTYFQDEIEFPFFDAFLRGDRKYSRPKATVFDSGAKVWKTFDTWPPTQSKLANLYLDPAGKLTETKRSQIGKLSYVSDPANPVPYQGGTLTRRTREYMLDDQKFAIGRPDVLTFTTDALTADYAVAGNVQAEIFTQISGTDCDFVVKVIDVFPANDPVNPNFHMLVRGEVMRSKFRNSFSNPQPMDPDRIERVPFSLPDICHTFKKGHRIEVQVQSSWFPLVDRNPGKFMNIFTATDADFQKCNIAVFMGGDSPSRIRLGKTD